MPVRRHPTGRPAPTQLRRLPNELARIDANLDLDLDLDDERFNTFWRTPFAARLGHPSIPIQTLLRLLERAHRFQLGYESLRRGVGDSIGCPRCCRIPLDQPVAAPTTLVNLVGRANPERR